MKKNCYKILTILCAALCLLSGLLLVYYVSNEHKRNNDLQELVQVHKEAVQEASRPVEAHDSILPELESMYRQNPDLAGWISLPAAGLDYPVVYDREDTPEYYLHRDFSGNHSIAGIPFIGIGADTDSDCLIIYGHNMADGSMFGQLENYSNEQFFSENPVFDFSTLHENRQYRIFASAYVKILFEGEEGFRYNSSVGILTEDEYMELLAFLDESAVQKTGEQPEYGRQIIILSTCDSRSYDGRFIVAGYLIEDERT